jgi:hypothetical protein
MFLYGGEHERGCNSINELMSLIILKDHCLRLMSVPGVARFLLPSFVPRQIFRLAYFYFLSHLDGAVAAGLKFRDGHMQEFLPEAVQG